MVLSRNVMRPILTTTDCFVHLNDLLFCPNDGQMSTLFKIGKKNNTSLDGRPKFNIGFYQMSNFKIILCSNSYLGHLSDLGLS